MLLNTHFIMILQRFNHVQTEIKKYMEQNRNFTNPQRNRLDLYQTRPQRLGEKDGLFSDGSGPN